ncbi:energy-coupling factor ABC transporter ATP-binding protein [Gemmobacter serpentinus]|uniref:energy-coupling factor ABC transporter ATP-binding protein n=1 Tax=Gemmobacter serpentinus TaxID=2652247 RepID=UPI00124E86B8|nr:ABC transporter ATP-binding protein [Gemmobacter serpentinus]
MERVTLETSISPAGLTLRDAGYAVAGKAILTGIDLHLTEARIGIVGRNGSGKSTLLRLMAGLIPPTAGEVRVTGIDPSRDRKAMLSTLGILFQNPDHQIIFPTVEEELAFGLRQQGQTGAEAATRVRMMLEAEARLHWAPVPVASLSQGQKQWLCLMAVLLMQPAILLLDEPFAALDLPTQARLTRRIAGLSQQVITISHDPASVTACDRVIWLEGGRIHADGAPEAVLPAFRAEMARLGDLDADTHLAG